MIVTPRYSPMGHVEREGPLARFQGRRSTVSRPMVVWRMDVVVGVIVGIKTHVALDVGRSDIQKLGPSKSVALLELHGESVLKFHEAKEVGMVALLERHDPATIIVVQCMLGGLLNKKGNIKKESVRKRREDIRMDKASRHRQANTMTTQNEQANGRRHKRRLTIVGNYLFFSSDG